MVTQLGPSDRQVRDYLTQSDVMIRGGNRH